MVDAKHNFGENRAMIAGRKLTSLTEAERGYIGLTHPYRYISKAEQDTVIETWGVADDRTQDEMREGRIPKPAPPVVEKAPKVEKPK